MLGKLSFRLVNFFAMLIVLGLLASAIYLQRAKGLEPCPLCVFQRLIFMGLAGLFFIGWLLPHWPKVIKGHNVFVILFALAGLVVALRQVWLIQFVTTAIPSCGADFYYMLKHLSFGEFLTEVMQGQGDCSKENWFFLGIGLPAWSALAFLFFMIVGVWQFLRDSNFR